MGFVMNSGISVTIVDSEAEIVTEWAISVTNDASWAGFVMNCGVSVTNSPPQSLFSQKRVPLSPQEVQSNQ